LVESLARLARLAEDDAALLAGLADALWRRAVRRCWPGLSVRLDGAAFAGEPAALRRRVLLRGLQASYDEDGGSAHEEAATLAFVDTLDSLLLSRRGGALDLPGRVRASVADGVLCLERKEGEVAAADWVYGLPVPGRVFVREAGLWLDVCPLPPAPSLWSSLRDGGEGRVLALRPLTVHLAASALPASSGLVVRPARLGERMAPLGMDGNTRPLRDVMASAGWPARLRDGAPVVYAAAAPGGRETPLWVVGLAQAESTRVTEETAAVVRLTARWVC
jgi:hypothetical protein